MLRILRRIAAVRRPVPYQPLVVLLAAFAAGISSDARWPLPAWLSWSAAVTMLALWWWLWRREAIGVTRDRWAMAPLLIAVASCGAAWHHDRWSLFAVDELGRRLTETPQAVAVIATLRRAPRWSPPGTPHPLANFPRRDETELEVRLEQLRVGDRWEPVHGVARVRVPGRIDMLSRGDRVRIFALASRPPEPRNPGEFDQAAFARAERRLCLLQAKSAGSVTKLRAGPRWAWEQGLDLLRARGYERLLVCVGPRHAALAAALLLGTREQLDDDLQRGFFVTGLAHLLAISGLNVAIFAYGFWFVARLGLFPRRVALLCAAGLAVFYAILTDAQPPVVRAAILVVCVCLARLSGRTGLAFNTLAASGLLVLLVNPTNLFQTGTQLSFLAVAVLALGSRREVTDAQESEPAAGEVTANSSGNTVAISSSLPDDPLDRLLARQRPWFVRWGLGVLRHVGAGFWTSAHVWLIALPLVVARFHLISLVALLLNPLVVLPAAVALYAGFGVLLVGDDWVGIGQACGWLCGRSLELIVQLIGWGESLPGNHVWTPAPPAWWLYAYLAGQAATVWLARYRLPTRWAWTAFVVWLAWGAVLIHRGDRAERHASDTLECTFISVGHGTSVLVRFPNGQNLLYDCGRLGWPPTATRSTAGVLWERGVRHLDAVVLSHADTDHYNGLPDLLDRFSVGVVYVSSTMFQYPSPPLDTLRDAIAARHIPCRELAANDVLRLGPKTVVEVLHPLATTRHGSDNSRSIVALIEHHGRRILLPGDLEPPGLDDLLAEEPLPCDVVMAPHHGSARSEPTRFLAWTSPLHVIISGSERHEVAAVERRYKPGDAQVWHTGRDGAITVRIDRNGVQVQPFRSVGAR